MTWFNRIKLLVGLVAVVAVAGVALIQLNDARGRATSTTAQIAAEAYTLGTPYSGTIVSQPAEVGQPVAEGDPVFVIDSPALELEIAEGLIEAEGNPNIDAEGNFLIRANTPGVLTDTQVATGAFVQASSELATVQAEGTLQVKAEYEMTASQYGRLTDGAPVTLRLPDGREMAASTADVSVERTDDGTSRVVLSVVSEELSALAREDRLITTGTPVVAEVELRNEGVVADISRLVKGYVSQATDTVTSAVGGA
ncbi:biotin attachment protein [Actinotalea ferrariae CF5-4]|uniref:Biotin attachment protein n=1 Tax=Actinotalea ferrariae CF5-4 TaxID=948458 RepID=A0A021VUL0_9CELL|nr:HlyD family efflux transporter periplasmic adaptor subunit [Actinotalea ferrariae]EYR62767.1 biotin attachment protein [Actinotalea ferrariae CF5-4]